MKKKLRETESKQSKKHQHQSINKLTTTIIIKSLFTLAPKKTET
jgi:hypothetical protein